MKKCVSLLAIFVGVANAQTIVSSYSADTGLVTRRVCNKIIQRVHYDRFDNSIIVSPQNEVSCRNEVYYPPTIASVSAVVPNTITQQPIIKQDNAPKVDKSRLEYIRDCVSYGINRKWCEKNWDGIIEEDGDSGKKQ